MALESLAVYWLATMALLISYVGVAKAGNSKTQTITLAAALVFWAAFALNATNYEIYKDAVVYSSGSQTLALIGILGAGATLVLLFESVFRAYRE